MADPGDVIARNDERLARLSAGEAAQRVRARRRQRTTEKFGKRVKRATLTALLIIVSLITWGLISGGIGTTVLILAILFGSMAVMAAAISVGDPPEPRNLTDAPAAALPAVTERWLDRRRRELPRLAAPQVDAISAKLATLEGQLAQVGPADPVAQDLSRLLGRHLPELVERYTRIPADQRARTIDSDGRTLETTLIEGLKVVEAELGRASDELASADRDALRVQGKFLESRYQGDALPPA
ncbi:MAG: hypothetical protein DCF31_16595 [Alphaproteobacteria bacterium]|nr:MAG: hypothetical protein DCF31_16595 [Alphaproteobacteria bacterium]